MKMFYINILCILQLFPWLSFNQKNKDEKFISSLLWKVLSFLFAVFKINTSCVYESVLNKDDNIHKSEALKR